MTSTRAPAWRYHPTEGGRIFQTEAELDALRPPWRDRPWAPDETSALVTDEAASETRPAVAPEVTSLGVAPVAAPAPPRRKNTFATTKTVS